MLFLRSIIAVETKSRLAQKSTVAVEGEKEKLVFIGIDFLSEVMENSGNSGDGCRALCM